MSSNSNSTTEIKPEEIKQIAHLARLGIAETEIPALANDLTQILQFIDQLAEIQTEGTEPLAHPLDMVQRLRKDCVTEKDQHETFQAIAPHTEEGLYLVPKVIE